MTRQRDKEYFEHSATRCVVALTPHAFRQGEEIDMATSWAVDDSGRETNKQCAIVECRVGYFNLFSTTVSDNPLVVL